MLPEWYEKAVELYLKDYTFTNIGKELCVHRKQVSYYLSLNGYTRQPIMSNTNTNLYKKYQFDENFFEVIDTEEKAYWLGFMYADGYVSEKKSSVELGLQESDSGHLEKFKNSLNSNHRISKTIRNIDGKEYIGCRLTLNSVKFKNDLINKGCMVRKTLRLTFPDYSIVPKDLMRHFIRGYVDADGCIYKKTTKGYSLEVVGTAEFLKGYVKELGVHENKIHYINKRSTASRVMYGGEYAESILEYLYSDANIYLDRKYNQVKSCVPFIG